MEHYHLPLYFGSLEVLNTYNIINPIQHTFRPSLPCQTQLLRKLEHYGIESRTHLWIQTWLIITNRTQKVVVGGDMSEKLKVLSGIPQGMVLGPLLFLLYVNDICDPV